MDAVNSRDIYMELAFDLLKEIFIESRLKRIPSVIGEYISSWNLNAFKNIFLKILFSNNYIDKLIL